MRCKILRTPFHSHAWSGGLYQTLANVTWPCLSFNSDLGQLLICPQAELHAFQMGIDIKDDTPSLFSLPVLPKESVFFHSNGPVTGPTLPYLCSVNKVTALEGCVRLQTLLFTLHVMCVCRETFMLACRWSWAVVSGIPLCCSSEAFLLTCDPFTDSEHRLLAQALYW